MILLLHDPRQRLQERNRILCFLFVRTQSIRFGLFPSIRKLALNSKVTFVNSDSLNSIG